MLTETKSSELTGCYVRPNGNLDSVVDRLIVIDSIVDRIMVMDSVVDRLMVMNSDVDRLMILDSFADRLMVTHNEDVYCVYSLFETERLFGHLYNPLICIHFTRTHTCICIHTNQILVLDQFITSSTHYTITHTNTMFLAYMHMYIYIHVYIHVCIYTCMYI